jgi:hypothetical protein
VADKIKPPTETRTDAEVLRQLSEVVKELAEVLSLLEIRVEKQRQ